MLAGLDPIQLLLLPTAPGGLWAEPTWGCGRPSLTLLTPCDLPGMVLAQRCCSSCRCWHVPSVPDTALPLMDADVSPSPFVFIWCQPAAAETRQGWAQRPGATAWPSSWMGDWHGQHNQKWMLMSFPIPSENPWSLCQSEILDGDTVFVCLCHNLCVPPCC